MKKINFGFVVMVLLLVTMTVIGTYMMEDYWVEDMSGVIWIVGIFSVAEIYAAIEIKSGIKSFMKEWESNHSNEEG